MDRREKYLEDFHRAVRDGKNENSYKLAWARALVEIACKSPAESGPRTISFEEIAELMIGYYWDHTIYFDLYQGQNPLRQPELVNLARGAIESFFAATGQRKPVSFVRIKAQLLELPTLKRIAAKILRQDVCHRFLNVGREKLTLYRLDIDAGEIQMAAGALSALRSHRAFLLDSICLKWAQLCEKWNRSPRIASKVQIVLPGGEPKRGALAKFLAFMLLENEGLKCFYTHTSVARDQLSLDHVIPWSFMYSDDLWNLVVTSRALNSQMGNERPLKDEIERLKERNARLLLRMEALNPGLKETFELRQSIERKFLDEYFFALG